MARPGPRALRGAGENNQMPGLSSGQRLTRNRDGTCIRKGSASGRGRASDIGDAPMRAYGLRRHIRNTHHLHAQTDTPPHDWVVGAALLWCGQNCLVALSDGGLPGDQINSVADCVTKTCVSTSPEFFIKLKQHKERV